VCSRYATVVQLDLLRNASQSAASLHHQNPTIVGCDKTATDRINRTVVDSATYHILTTTKYGTWIKLVWSIYTWEPGPIARTNQEAYVSPSVRHVSRHKLKENQKQKFRTKWASCVQLEWFKQSHVEIAVIVELLSSVVPVSPISGLVANGWSVNYFLSGSES